MSNIKVFWGLLIPFLGTTLGAGMVFLMKNKINKKIEKLLLGFASGVMIAASVWSLLIPYLHLHTDKPEGLKAKIEKTTMMVLAVTLHNIPEGAIISMPLKSEGMSKSKAFLYGTLSGIVEPIGATLTIALTNLVVPILPYFLSFAAGSMIYVVVEELIPESQNGEHSNIGTVGVAIGFVIMMILDVALG